MTELKAKGIGREIGSPQYLFIGFNRQPTDDEMRAIHEFLRRPPPTCPFCQKPHYGALPCWNCGEPDIPDF